MGAIHVIEHSHASLACVLTAKPACVLLQRALPGDRHAQYFQLANACYERCTIILTSNRSFGEWGEVFGDSVVAAAPLDRLLHT